MTRRRLTVFLGVLVVAWGLWASGDTIFYREGEQEPGRLLGMTATDVTFEGAAGVKTVAKVDVTQIQLQRARKNNGRSNSFLRGDRTVDVPVVGKCYQTGFRRRPHSVF